MSLFLGPIHYALFNKIKFQYDFCDFLVRAIKEVNSPLYEDINSNTYILPDLPLEEVVDTDNIHASLQNMISQVELKLAYIVNSIAGEAVDVDVYALAEQYGLRHAINSDATVEEAFKFMQSNFLNGMPCDRVQEVLEADENSIKWREVRDIHQAYWQEFGRDGREFYLIRTAILTGILSNTKIEFVEEDEFSYILRRKV